MTRLGGALGNHPTKGLPSIPCTPDPARFPSLFSQKGAAGEEAAASPRKGSCLPFFAGRLPTSRSAGGSFLARCGAHAAGSRRELQAAEAQRDQLEGRMPGAGPQGAAGVSAKVSEMRQGRGVRVGRGAGARLPAHASPAGSLTQDCATSPESGFRTVLFGAAPVANPGGRGKGGGVVGIQAVGGPLAELSFAPPPWTGDALWPVGDLGAGTWNAKLAPPQGPLCKQFHLPLPTW
ncbi:Solute Carrier Organic Anion Transporter Family Member 4A1 [Manis pentadactyla]|nr:Solute Carrier Organic Anion Transporter Family Member 4A1 [Manis pentadactyla]